MLLHEYQAKDLFHRYGMPVPKHLVANTASQVRRAAEQLIADTVVVKAQVHSGGRTSAGGVKIVDTPREAEDYARAMLGTHLVTGSTAPEGKLVNTLLVEETCLVATELYLSIHIDPVTSKTIFTVGRETNEHDITLHEETPQQDVFELDIDRKEGIQSSQCAQLSQNLKLSPALNDQFAELLTGLCKLFVEKDLNLVEINPLVITEDDQLVCLDGKIVITPEALQQQAELQAMRDKTQEPTPGVGPP